MTVTVTVTVIRSTAYASTHSIFHCPSTAQNLSVSPRARREIGQMVNRDNKACPMDATTFDKLRRLAVVLEELGIEHGTLTDNLGWRLEVLGVDGQVFITPKAATA